MTTEEKTLTISDLAPNKGARRRRKRLGIGEGSGNGKTCGHGQKGQRSRSGYSMMPGFEGGQMPLYRRLPKTGFTSRMKLLGENRYRPVSLETLEVIAKELKTTNITLANLVECGVVKEGIKVKILGNTGLTQKLNVEAHAISESAKSVLEKVGGSIKLL